MVLPSSAVPARSPTAARWLALRLGLVAAPALGLTVPFLDLFGDRGVPLLAGPSLLVLGLAALPGVVLGALAGLGAAPHPGRVRRGVALVALAALALLLVDAAWGGYAWLRAVVPSEIASPGARRLLRLGMLGAAVGLLALAFRPVVRHVRALVVLCPAVMFCATLLEAALPLGTSASDAPTPATGDARPDAPPLVYLILDEAMGPEGLARAPGGEATARAVTELFTRHGFRVHGAAFSRHRLTAQSVPLTLDFVDDGTMRGNPDARPPGRLGLFDRFVAAGYEIAVYQTEHLDLCVDGVARCETAPAYNPLSRYLSDRTVRIAALLQSIRHGLWHSYQAELLTEVIEHATGIAALPNRFAAFDAFAFPAWFDHVSRQVRDGGRGQAVVAHLLAPHSPYVLDEACRYDGSLEIGYDLAQTHGYEGEAFAARRAEVYQAYLAQYGCVLGRLDRFLSALLARPDMADATIVVHGDHGSRISRGSLDALLTEADLIDNHSTLFAIRRPGVAAGYDRLAKSVQRLVAEYFEAAPATPPSPDVVVSTEDGMTLRPFPFAPGQ